MKQALSRTVSHLLPLRSLAIRCDARAGLARVVLEQRFANDGAEALDVEYRFPLPPDAVISGFAFTVGDRRAVGRVERRADARARFEEAMLAGRTAALLDEERASLFTERLGCVPPGAEVVVEIVIDQKLRWVDESAWEWRFPLAAAPRYLGEPGRVDDAREVAIAIEERVAASAVVELIARDALAPGRAPESPSHAIASVDVGGARRVSFARGPAPLDRDVVVRWGVARAETGLVIDVTRAANSGAAHALVTLVPPAGPPETVVARDVVVILDTSGSMSGEPLAQARRVVAAIVDSLAPADSLEMIAFSTHAIRFRPEPAAATDATRRAALAWLASLEAQGGTEMGDAIERALVPFRSGTQRDVILVSDGLVGFERELVKTVIEGLPASSRLHTVGVGSAVNRSLTSAIARAGRGAEIVIGLGEDAERAARSFLAATCAPVLVDVEIAGSAVVRTVPARLRDVFAGAPLLTSVELRASGGEIVARGRAASGAWEARARVPAITEGEGSPAVGALFGREVVDDAEMRLAGGASCSEIDALVESTGLEFQIATKLTSWIAVGGEPAVDPRAPRRVVSVPQALAHGMVQHSPEPAALDLDEKTRVTAVVMPAQLSTGLQDCLVVISTDQPALLGRRYTLDPTTRLGRGSDNAIVLEGDSVSRRHAVVERRAGAWMIGDEGSTNGTFLNDQPVARDSSLKSGDHVKIGRTILKFLSGADVEAQYHEEIYRLTIMDGLTQVYNKRYLFEALEREIVRCRRHRRDLAVLMVDVDHFKRINDEQGHLAGDAVLKELASVLGSRMRRDELLARFGGEEFAVLLPESNLAAAAGLAESLRARVEGHAFEFQGIKMAVTISGGAAALEERDRSGADLVGRADERLYAAKAAGRNRIVS